MKDRLIHYKNCNEINPEKIIFSGLASSDGDSVSDNFDDNLFNKIDKIQYHRRTNYKRILSIAAVFLIMALPSIWLYQNKTIHQDKGLVITEQNYYQNKEKADKEIGKALSLVSKNLDIAKNEMKKIEYLDKSINKIKKLYFFKQNNKTIEA